VIIQSLCEITLLAQKAGIPRHIFLESINKSVLARCTQSTRHQPW